MSTLSTVATLSGHKFGVSCVAFTPSSQYVVSVSALHQIMEFELETDTLNYDLTVQYSTIVTIPSVECGPSVKIEDLQWSSSAFDSVALVNPILNYDELINAEIYF